MTSRRLPLARPRLTPGPIAPPSRHLRLALFVAQGIASSSDKLQQLHPRALSAYTRPRAAGLARCPTRPTTLPRAIQGNGLLQRPLRSLLGYISSTLHPRPSLLRRWPRRAARSANSQPAHSLHRRPTRVHCWTGREWDCSNSWATAISTRGLRGRVHHSRRVSRSRPSPAPQKPHSVTGLTVYMVTVGSCTSCREAKAKCSQGEPVECSASIGPSLPFPSAEQVPSVLAACSRAPSANIQVSALDRTLHAKYADPVARSLC